MVGKGMIFLYISAASLALGTFVADPYTNNMYWQTAVVVLITGVATAARLDKNYLPPSGAAYSGGTGGTGGIVAPYGGSGGAGGYSGSGAGKGGAGSQGGYGGSGGVGVGGYGGASGAGGYGGAGGAGGYGGASGPVIPIVSYENNPNLGDGSYSWSYVTANEIKAQEEGYLNPNAPDGPGESAKGSFSYVAPDGQQVSVYYTADENGFIPQGAHLPTSPPIPAEILESLQKNAADEAAGIYDDGSYRGEGAGAGAAGYGSASGTGGYGGSSIGGSRGYGGSGAGGASGYGGSGAGVSSVYGGNGASGAGGAYQGGAKGYSYPKPGK